MANTVSAFEAIGMAKLLAEMGGERTEDRVVLDAVPDGWAKVGGCWVKLRLTELQGEGDVITKATFEADR